VREKHYFVKKQNLIKSPVKFVWKHAK